MEKRSAAMVFGVREVSVKSLALPLHRIKCDFFPVKSQPIDNLS